MEIKQVVSGGKLTSSYMSSWNNELNLTVTGGHEFNVKIAEDELRDLANRINERLGTIDKEREEEMTAKVEAAVLAAEEAEEVLDSEED